MPVARAHDRSGVAEERPPHLLHRDEQPRQPRTTLQSPLGSPHPPVLQPRLGGRGGELVAAGGGRALGVMRQPVLVGVDADEILEGAGEARLLVRLQLGQVDQDIGVHRRPAEQVLVAGARVAGVRLRHVVAGAVEAAAPLVPHELAGPVETHVGAPEGVARQPGRGDGDPVDGMPLLGTEVEQFDPEAGEVAPAPIDHGVQGAVAAQAGEGGVGLGCVADGDAPVPCQPGRDPPDHGLDHGRVGDDVLPRAGAGRSLVVLLDPVRLEHDPIAGLDEGRRQVEGLQGVVNEPGDRGGVVVGGDPGEGGHAGVGGRVGHHSQYILAVSIDVSEVSPIPSPGLELPGHGHRHRGTHTRRPGSGEPDGVGPQRRRIPSPCCRRGDGPRGDRSTPSASTTSASLR